MDLLTDLIAKQNAIGATDKAFAETLGIPRETWTAIRAGRVALDGRVLLKVARTTRRVFPDLADVAASSLLGEPSDAAHAA